MDSSDISSLLKLIQVAYLRCRASGLQQEELRAADRLHMHLSEEQQ
jgi:hypothetical protein